MTKLGRLLQVLIAGLACCIGTARGAEYRVEIETVPVSRHPARGLLGVHSLWWGHQAGLFNVENGQTRPEVIAWLKATGGIVRYGGGVNELPWAACTGPRVARIPFKAVPWAGSMVCQFGVEEYLGMTRQTGSDTAWHIANLAGVNYQIWPNDTMAQETGRAAGGLAGMAPDLKRVWELGNELERGRYEWSPERIAERSNIAAKAILAHDPEARLILPLIEYDHPGQPKRQEFNARLLKGIAIPVDGIALHLYYDGSPGGPAIPTQIRTVEQSAALYRQLKGKGAEVWITEHGRWPQGEGSDPTWQSRWYQTNDMGGVLGTADFLIALSQVPDVAGAMLHGLRAGPWNVFDVVDGRPQLTGVGRLLEMFGRSGAVVRWQTSSNGPNRSGYRGGYDVRAAAFGTNTPGESVLWVINRALMPSQLSIQLPASLNVEFSDGLSLLCAEANGRCQGAQFRELAIRASQVSSNDLGLLVSLPAASVSVIRLKGP